MNSSQQKDYQTHERISLYRNEEERQSVMKMITDQQLNYQRLQVKKRLSNNMFGQPIKMVKPKTALESKNMGAFKKVAAVAPKQRNVSQMKGRRD